MVIAQDRILASRVSGEGQELETATPHTLFLAILRDIVSGYAAAPINNDGPREQPSLDRKVRLLVLARLFHAQQIEGNVEC